MNARFSVPAPFLGAAALSACFAIAAVAQGGRTEGQLALVGGTIYPNPADEPIRGGVVLIQNGRIAAVGSPASVQLPPNIESIDCSGQTITAGFWNSHVHFFERKWADVAAIPAPELARQLTDMLTLYGFTSAFDIGSALENTRRLRSRIESGEVPGPRIRSTGEALVAPGAVPPDAVIRALGFTPFRNFEIADASQAAMAAREILDAGADGLKVHLQRPPPPKPPFPEGAIQSVVDEARRTGKPVFVHPASGADVLAAARAGADVVAHTTPASGPWDATTLGAMKERRVALTPTLTLWRSLFRHDRRSRQEQSVSAAVEQLRAWVAAGGTVLFGNDLGAVDYDPSEEYSLMAEAGMSFRQILASLTTAPAERFGALAELGRIAPGLIADLTVLRNDPSKDIRALASVQYTVREGKIIYRGPR